MELNLCMMTLRVYKNHKTLKFRVSLSILTNRELLLLIPSLNITLFYTLCCYRAQPKTF